MINELPHGLKVQSEQKAFSQIEDLLIGTEYSIVRPLEVGTIYDVLYIGKNVTRRADNAKFLYCESLFGCSKYLDRESIEKALHLGEELFFNKV